MKLNAEIAGESVALEVRREGGRVVAEVGGRRYELEARRVGDGEYLLLGGGRVYECRVGAAGGEGGGGGRLSVAGGARGDAVSLTDPQHPRGARAGGGGRARGGPSGPA